MTRKGVDDELDMLRWHSFDGFLDYMVSILIFDAQYHVVFELFDELCLLVSEDVFKSLDMLVETS